MKWFAALMWLVPAVAHAQVSGELSAGAGKDSSAGGYATVSARIEGASLHPLPRLMPGAPGVLTFYFSRDPDDQNGVSAEADAIAHETADQRGSTLITSAKVAARGYGWQLSGAVAYQPIGDLRQTFWRSGRDVLASTIGVEVPGSFGWADPQRRLWFGQVGVDYTWRTDYAGLAEHDGGYSLALDARFFTYQNAVWQLLVANVHADGFGIFTAGDAATTSGMSASYLALDIAKLAVHVGRYQLAFLGGTDTLTPISAFTAMVSDTYSDMPSTQPERVTPRYWAELAERDGFRAWHVGAGSWARLDPSGYAADAGQLVEAGVEGAVGKVQLDALAQAGRLRRLLVTNGAPVALARPGTSMYMGRIEASARASLAAGFALAGSAWAERSDRDDPRWVGPADGSLATHAGVDISARISFRAL